MSKKVQAIFKMRHLQDLWWDKIEKDNKKTYTRNYPKMGGKLKTATMAVQDASCDMATYKIASAETPCYTPLQAAETYSDVQAMNKRL